jgi:hypothetical protein
MEKANLPYLSFVVIQGNKCYVNGEAHLVFDFPKLARIRAIVDLLINFCGEHGIDYIGEDTAARCIREAYNSTRSLRPTAKRGDDQPTKPKELIEVTEDLKRKMTLDEVSEVLSSSIKRDEAAKKICFLGMLLAQSNSSQINIGFQAESSSGKSYLPIELSNYFPANEVSLIASASPTAFFHDRGEWIKETGVLRVNLEGRILVFLDMPGYQLLEKLRPLLSHDRKVLHYKITDRSQKAGLRTKNVELIGYPCVIFCSAKLDADEQERTRMILLSPSVDEDKLKDSLMLASLRNSDPEEYAELIENDSNRKTLINRIKAIRQSGIKEVKIANHETLVLKRFLGQHQHLKARHQRDFPRIINLIKGHALLNCFNRKRVGNTIEATEIDIDAGFALYAEIQESNDLGLSPYIHRIYLEVIKPYLSDTVGLDKKQIHKHYYRSFHKPISSAALNDILTQLEAANLIDLQQDPADKRRSLVFLPEK